MPSILAIESSCDETSASVCVDGKILSNFTANQKIHEQYGGVVPELASRAHLQNIVPVVDQALVRSGVALQDIDAIAFTQSPGLIGALLVGSQFAKSLAMAHNKPLIAVHHMQAHVLANLIDAPRPSFPFLCLTVSGGHTQIVLAKSANDLEILGTTIDDAAGEAFDKSAKLLGLPYPGGPLIEKHGRNGDAEKFRFPEPHAEGLDFSFSGLKTSVMYFIQKEKSKDSEFVEKNLADLCASIEKTIVSILIKKLTKAALQTGISNICIAGGVSANTKLRQALTETGKIKGWNTYVPAFEYCTDNAAMIAITAYYKFLEKDFSDLTVSASARSSW